MNGGTHAGQESGTDEWTRSGLFMRRSTLDDLLVLPPVPDRYELWRYRPDDCAALAALLTGTFYELWDDAHVCHEPSETPDVEQTFIVIYHNTSVTPCR